MPFEQGPFNSTRGAFLDEERVKGGKSQRGRHARRVHLNERIETTRPVAAEVLAARGSRKPILVVDVALFWLCASLRIAGRRPSRCTPSRSGAGRPDGICFEAAFATARP